MRACGEPHEDCAGGASLSSVTNETTASVQAADAPAELPVTGRRDVVRRAFGILRIAAGLLVLASIATQIIDEILHDAFKPDEYFSYFTIETSLINIVVLLVGGVLALRARWDSGLFTSIRMAIVTYATVTAVVYAVLLRPIPPVGYVGPQWPNEVIHVIVPIFIGLDWLLAPGRPANRVR